MSGDGDIDRSLGRLEATTDAIKDMVENLSKQVAKIGDDAHTTRARLEALEKRLSAVEPVVSEIGVWKERAIGARMAIAVAWVAVGGAISAGFAWIWAHIPWAKGGP